MTKEYTFPLRFKLVVDHLNAVLALHEYVNGAVGLKKDMQGLSNYLQLDLSRSILQPAGWEDLYAQDGNLYSSPKSKQWRVRGDVIAIEIYPGSPVGDLNEPYVNLYVPPSWKKQKLFISKLEAPKGFEHVNRYSGELADEVSVWKDVKYTTYVGAEGQFDSAAFLGAFREATKALVGMETSIDRILEGLA